VSLEVLTTGLPDVLLLQPKVFVDDRGFFFESFNARAFGEATGVEVVFVQDNHSRSSRNVLRGLHYQLPPAPQGKLVRVVSGEIFDVAVDLRRWSPTFGQWTGQRLSAENRRQMWIPAGFAHGFLTLSDMADVLYKTTAYYAPACDRSLRWDDPDLAIAWPLDGTPLLSPKDAAAALLADATCFDAAG
jgi:dTDP-4-dehydrorhamnose 3,5-epimerase